MPSRRQLSAVPVALALGVVALPVASARATPVPPTLKPCYVSVNPAETEYMRIVATGFKPNAAVQIRITDEAPVIVDADAAGTVRARPSAPAQARGERTVTVTLTDTKNVFDTVTATTEVTALSVRVRPKRAATSSRVRVRGRGFTRAQAIWGHYVFRGRVRKTVRLAAGPASGCGTFSARGRLIPIRHPRLGRWTLQIDQQRRWSPQPHSVFVPVPIIVQRVIGRR